MAGRDEIIAALGKLPDASLDELERYIEYLLWKETRPAVMAETWTYDFMENLHEATVTASRDRAGMEVKIAEATCGGVTRPALWEHPPLTGHASVEHVVPIPPGVRDLKVKFAIGIRDGAELPSDRFVAFRVLVNGWKLWSAVKNSRQWDAYEIKMPQLASDVVRVEFVTDGLGDHRWNWAVWAEPCLVGGNE
jgi:hypothetical protein